MTSDEGFYMVVLPAHAAISENPAYKQVPG